MGQMIAINDRFRAPQVALIRRMNPDCNNDEFDQFMHVSATLGLDPLKRQVYAFVFNKNDTDKRRMSIIIGIDGFRAVAKRSGAYRPDDKPMRFVIDPEKIDPDSNPLGLVSAEVTVYQHAQGGWWPVTAIAFWDEFAPIIMGGEDDEYEWIDTGETWPDTGKPKKKKRLKQGVTTKPRLDPKKDNWRKMPRVMLSKCAEAQAIRRGWPEDLSSVYSDEELDRAHTLDLTATEMAESAEVEKRLTLIGGADSILFDMGSGLERVPLGKAGDMLMARFKDMQPFEVLQWRNMNRVPLQEFWARSKSDALEIKKYLEKIEAETP
jgi:phage recombination protein Bet